MCQLLLQFADKLDEIQKPYIYIDKIDGELIRSININTMISILTKSHVFIIGYKNKTGQSSFHIAILYGYISIMNLFLKHVNKFGMNYLLEDTDRNIRTPLHIASFKGYNKIVEKLFLLNVNVYIRDNQESTPLHCVARCVGRKCYDDNNDASVCILEIFLKYIQNYKKISFDLLTALDGFGHNCLETAIISRNRSFVEYLLNLNNTLLFKNLLRNAQLLDIHHRHVDTPLRKLVIYMPDLAYRVLDICITYIGNKHKIIYDFQFLEDHCYIQQWQHNITSQIIKNESMHKFFCRIFCHHKLLEFQSQFHHHSLPAYTANPYTLVHNSVLSVMCNCAKKINLKDQEDEEENNKDHSKNIQHIYRLMHHPLCHKLMQLKWKQFVLPLFLTSFLIYCLYLSLFTAIMLRNRQPEYFYRLVNASFPSGRHFNGTQLVSFNFFK